MRVPHDELLQFYDWIGSSVQFLGGSPLEGDRIAGTEGRLWGSHQHAGTSERMCAGVEACPDHGVVDHEHTEYLWSDIGIVWHGEIRHTEGIRWGGTRCRVEGEVEAGLRGCGQSHGFRGECVCSLEQVLQGWIRDCEQYHAPILPAVGWQSVHLKWID